MKSVLPLLCTGCLISSPLLVLSSCGSKADKIYLESPTYTTKEHEFSIPAYFNFTPTGEVSFELKNSDENIALKSNKATVVQNKIDLFFIIDEKIQDSKVFSFDIQFTYIKDNETLTFSIYNVAINFEPEEIIDRDNLWLESYLSSSVNSHVFKFICFLPRMPVSDEISVSLTHKSSNLFELINDKCKIIEDNPYPYIEVEVQLSMLVFDRASYYFDMNLSFINSHDKAQDTIFKNCVIQYDRDITEEIPADYFDLEPVEESEGKYVLHGLKNNIPVVEAGKYRVLQIPSDVIAIDDHAFYDAEWLKGIRTLVITNSVETIGEDAFIGLKNIYEMNLKDYLGHDEPQWYKDEINLFANEEMTYKYGYMWIPSSFANVKDSTSFNLPPDWEVADETKVADEDMFTFSGDNQDILSGINTGRLDDLVSRKIIRIPDRVKTISNGALNLLQKRIYWNKDLERYETRRILLPRSLETVSASEFRFAGIAGPIFVLSQNLPSIPESLFEYCTDYSYPPTKNVYIEDSRLVVVDCNQLISYENKSFNHVNLVGKFELSVPIKSIGDFAFLDNNLTEIVFNDNCDSVGYEAFASTSYYPPISNLTLIDLSKYTTIKNPGEGTPTYQPEWFSVANLAFLGACDKNGGKIILSNEIWNEDAVSKDREKWEKEFREKHSIPDSWEFEAA